MRSLNETISLHMDLKMLQKWKIQDPFENRWGFDFSYVTFRISLLAIKIQWLKVGSGSYVTEIKKVCTFAQTSIRAVLAQPPSPLSPLVESGSLMANLLRACLDRSRPAQPSWIRPGGSGGAENHIKNWSHQNRWRAEQILANHRLHS